MERFKSDDWFCNKKNALGGANCLASIEISQCQMSAPLLNPFSSIGSSKPCLFSPLVASTFEITQILFSNTTIDVCIGIIRVDFN